MHVIGAGFGRTGTQTLQNALNALGYNCFHTKELVSATPSFVLLWDELGDRMLDWETTEKKVASKNSASGSLAFDFDRLFGVTLPLSQCMLLAFHLPATMHLLFVPSSINSPSHCLVSPIADYGYNATVDFPSCMFYKFLMDANPKAKVLFL